jgi:hypothetical protein
MPWRVWRPHPDPNKRRAFIVSAIVGMALFAGVIWWMVDSMSTNEEKIAERPTSEQVLRVLDAVRRDQRRACRVVNARFATLADVIAGQRPSAETTDYYRTRPGELQEAQRNFDRTLAALEPINCKRRYPPPTIEDVTDAEVTGGGGAASGPNAQQPP